MTYYRTRLGLLSLIGVAASNCLAVADTTPAPLSFVRQTETDEGLPRLPQPSGSGMRGGSYGTLPLEAKVVLEQLDCKVGNPTKAKVFQIVGQDGKTDFMVTDRSDSRFHYWIRSFAGTGGTTGYLAQLNGCPAWTVGMRAYIAKDGGAPEDVTASILARGGFPDENAMKKYVDQGASELFAQFERLDRVPVVRWFAEADPDRALVLDKRTFDHGGLVHGGFLVWAGDHFEVRQKVAAAMWPCD
ncbi:hypothetical protein, partial [Stenotrophomonas sp. CFBP 13725]|uniref:hypothetical protein n=1 Tax=Stenotrophomonas sp. CFBP 13725 TaxID=2775297 RepID=UPI001780A007